MSQSDDAHSKTDHSIALQHECVGDPGTGSEDSIDDDLKAISSQTRNFLPLPPAG